MAAILEMAENFVGPRDFSNQGPANFYACIRMCKVFALICPTIGDLVQSHKNQPQTHRSTRQISRELGIPQTNNWRWLDDFFCSLFIWQDLWNYTDSPRMSEVNPRRHYIILRHYHTDFLKLYLAHLAILSSLGRVYDRVQVHCGVWAVYRPVRFKKWLAQELDLIS